MADSPASQRGVEDPRRSQPRDVHESLRRGRETLLVCAYENDAGFRKFPLEGAIPLSQLIARHPELERDREIVFYCRCPGDKTATEMACRYLEQGFERAGVLAGGVVAWQAARLPMQRRAYG